MIMIASGKPRKQRLFRYTASNSERQKLAHAHVSKELAKKLGIRLRSTSVRKGDTVRIMSGKSRGKSGKIIGVNLKSATVFVENVVELGGNEVLEQPARILPFVQSVEVLDYVVPNAGVQEIQLFVLP